MATNLSEVVSVVPTHQGRASYNWRGQKETGDGSLQVSSKSFKRHVLETHGRSGWGSLVTVPGQRAFQIRKLAACLIAFFWCHTPGTRPILTSNLPFEVQCLNSPRLALPTRQPVLVTHSPGQAGAVGPITCSLCEIRKKSAKF